MARLPRLILAGMPHLISQRAQHGQAMVRDGVDRAGLMQLLREAAGQHRVAVHAYSLLPGRLDLVATPEDARGVSLLMQSVSRRHAAAFNRRHGRSGGLWEGRFRVAVVEPASWLLTGMLYVEQLGRLIPGGAAAADTSEAAHRGQGGDPLLVHPPVYWALGNTPFERELAYAERVDHLVTAHQQHAIEAALRGGWALGSADFIAGLARLGDRPPAPRPRGRPAKAKMHQ